MNKENILCASIIHNHCKANVCNSSFLTPRCFWNELKMHFKWCYNQCTPPKGLQNHFYFDKLQTQMCLSENIMDFQKVLERCCVPLGWKLWSSWQVLMFAVLLYPWHLAPSGALTSGSDAFLPFFSSWLFWCYGGNMSPCGTKAYEQLITSYRLSQTLVFFSSEFGHYSVRLYYFQVFHLKSRWGTNSVFWPFLSSMLL